MSNKILILTNSGSGLYDFRNLLLKQLVLSGYNVCAVIPNNDHENELNDIGIKTMIVPVSRRGTNPVTDFKLYKNYKKIISEFRPNVVLTYTIKPNIYGGLAARRMGVPYISTVTGLGSVFQKNGLLKQMVCFLYRMAMKKCRCLFFQNIQNKNVFYDNNILAINIRLVAGSGVDLTRFLPESYPGHNENYTQFLYLGRFMREKGFDELIDAARIMKDEYDDKVQFLFVGYADDNYDQKLKDGVRAGYFDVLPYQNDVEKLYEAADVVVMPSHHEGMNNVLMEASACGRPVIASNISGCYEIVNDYCDSKKPTGILFEAKNTESLVGAMKTFMSFDINTRREMGLNARTKMEREFDRMEVTNAYLNEIRRLL